MQSHARKQFIDQAWGAADLDLLAEFWLRLYELVAPSRGFSANPQHTFEVRLTGFARHDGEKLRDELARLARDSDVPDPDVTLHDPDTLVLSSGESSGEDTPPAGLGLPLLAGPTFEGLVAEFRFRTTGQEGVIFRSGTAKSTLVIVGALRAGKLLVKVVWRSGVVGWEDDIYRSEASRDEAPLLAGLEAFRETREVSKRLAKQLFRPSLDDRVNGWGLKLVYVPPGRPRFLRLSLRAGAFAALLGALAWLIHRLIEEEDWFWLVLLAATALHPVLLVITFVRIESKLLFSMYRVLRAQHDRHYEDASPYVPLSPAETARLADDPAVRKASAALVAAGFTHIGDVAQTPTAEAGMVYRNFQAADGVTYLVILCHRWVGADPESRTCLFPATVAFEAQTFFVGGGRVDSATGGYEYWQSRVDENTWVRRDTDATDPMEFYRSHVAAAEAFAAEKGLTPKRHERFEDFVRRQQAIHDEERDQYRDRPYSWWDHLRWYLQWPRREQRG